MTEKSEDQVVWACVKCGSYMIDEYRLEDKGGHWPMYTKSFICNKKLEPYYPHSKYVSLKSDLAKAVEALEVMMKRYRYVWGECEHEPEYKQAKEALGKIGVK